MNGYVISPEKVRLYALIDALESDLVAYIESELLTNRPPEEVFSEEEHAEASRRRNDEVTGETASLVSYLNLSDKFHLISRHRRSFRRDEVRSFRVLGTQVQVLNDIRRRTHHSRPLHPGDQQNGLEAAAAIIGTELPFEQLRQALQLLQADPDWVPDGVVAVDLSATLHNIPPGDFDSTGLIGREAERNTLRKWLIGPNYPVVSVIAPGGYGKTALAVQVLHDIADDPKSPYEMIAYVSLQTETLTVKGIKEIVGAVSSLDEAVVRLLEPLSDERPDSAAILSEALDGIACLLVIDNLETVTGAEVITFIESMPASTRFLFTSRVGIGELERRLNLDSLGLPQAVHLIRQLGAQSGLSHFEHGDRDELERIASRLDCVPLKIKWAVQTCETGLDIDVVLANTASLDEFCVASLFDCLPDNAADVAWALFALARPVPASQLILCLDLSADESRAAIQELFRRMFVTQIATDRSTQVLLELSTSLRGHMRRLNESGDSNKTVIERAVKVDENTKAEMKKLDAERERGITGPNVIRGGREHNAAKALLRQALTLTAPFLNRSDRDLPGAYGLIDDAQAIDPGFWEVYRVRAFLMAQTSGEIRATKEYETALELAPPNEVAQVKHWFSGYLTRHTDEHERAVELARDAAQELQLPDSQFSLGVALQRAGNLEEAIHVLGGLREDAGIDHAMQIRATSALLNTFRRRSLRIIETSRDTEDGIATFEEALSLAKDAITRGLVDERIVAEIADQIPELLRFCSIDDDPSKVAALLDDAIETYDLVRLRNGAQGSNSHVMKQCERLRDRSPEWEQVVRPLFEAAKSAMANRHLGYITTFDYEKDRGFIDSLTFDKRLRFHRDSFTDQTQIGLVKIGACVTFKIAYFAAYGRDPICVEIAVESPAEDLGNLHGRVVTVSERMPRFAFVRESLTGISAFLHNDYLEADIAWEEIQIGTEWVGDLEIGSRGQFQVVGLRR